MLSKTSYTDNISYQHNNNNQFLAIILHKCTNIKKPTGTMFHRESTLYTECGNCTLYISSDTHDTVNFYF